MSHSIHSAFVHRQSNFDPFRNIECAREVLFDYLHEMRGNPPVTPPVGPVKKNGFLARLLGKIGGAA